MRTIKDKTFSGVSVDIDGTIFTNCKFSGCEMTYRGGPFKFDGCNFGPDCIFAFTGAAGLTLTMLGLLRALGYDINKFIPSQIGQA